MRYRDTHTVVPLRKVALPEGDGWMTREAAEAAGVDLTGWESDMGPRRRGVVYFGAYRRTVKTVHEVFVRVGYVRDDPGRALVRAVTWWSVVEESSGDRGRMREHCTPWAYDARNAALFTIG